MTEAKAPELPSTVEFWIERLRAGDDSARSELLRHASARLVHLARRLLGDFPRLGRWEEAEDVCQNAAMRLWEALREVRPETVRDFFRLAALQTRRELIDLSRKHFGPHGIGANHATDPGRDSSSPAFDRAESTHDPGRIASWGEFHQQVEELPDEAREAFDLLWYQGLSQAETAVLLGISEPTVKRRWRAARLLLGQALDGEPPG